MSLKVTRVPSKRTSRDSMLHTQDWRTSSESGRDVSTTSSKRRYVAGSSFLKQHSPLALCRPALKTFLAVTIVHLCKEVGPS